MGVSMLSLAGKQSDHLWTTMSNAHCATDSPAPPIFKNKDYREVLVREMDAGKIPISLGKIAR